MTQTDLEQLGARWQDGLRLLDWDIVFRLVPASEIDQKAGECRYDIGLHRATIKVLDPRWDENGEDPEETLVHELLHVKAAGFHNVTTGQLEGAGLLALEIMVEQISQLLVKLDREKQIVALESKKAQIDETLRILAGGDVKGPVA